MMRLSARTVDCWRRLGMRLRVASNSTGSGLLNVSAQAWPRRMPGHTISHGRRDRELSGNRRSRRVASSRRRTIVSNVYFFLPWHHSRVARGGAGEEHRRRLTVDAPSPARAWKPFDMWFFVPYTFTDVVPLDQARPIDTQPAPRAGLSDRPH